MYRPLVHIGLHKTGTSYLQQMIFNIPDLGFVAPDRGRLSHLIHTQFANSDPFARVSKNICKELRDEIKHASDNNNTWVMSHERLSGYPASGMYDSVTILNRLFDVFPDARILIVIREQRSLISSMYSQYITDGGYLSLEEYLEGLDPNLSRMPHFQLENYRFDNLINAYQSRYGVENVCVQTYECFQHSRIEFIKNILKFCDIQLCNAQVLEQEKQINIRVKASMQQYTRLLNSMFLNNQFSPARLFSSRNLYDYMHRVGRFVLETLPTSKIDEILDARNAEKICEKTRDFYELSNRRTESLVSLDLSSLGYQVIND